MKLYRTKDYDEMSHKATEFLAAQVLLKPNSLLGMATGSTPLGLYGNLVKQYNDKGLDFSKIRAINLDEYLGLPAESPQSYAYYMKENLFSHININLDNVFLPNGLEKDREKECQRYDALINDLGTIDMQILGIGENGHIGFNEPADMFYANTQCVSLTESTIKVNSQFFSSFDEVPKFAYTMGLKPIMTAKRIILLASGPNKAEVLYKAFHQETTPQLPASILRLHKNVTIIADEEALSFFER